MRGVYIHFFVCDVPQEDGSVVREYWLYIGSAREGWDQFLSDRRKGFFTRRHYSHKVREYGLKGR